jgi:hypothetical protein
MPTNNYNQFSAQYIAGIDGKPVDNIISTWTAILPCNWFIETKNHSHSEGGWKLSVLWPYLLMEPLIMEELFRTVPDFPHSVWDDEKSRFMPNRDGILFFSAASRMGGGTDRPGTRFIMADVLLNHPERWDIYARTETPEECWRSFMRAWNQRGKRYDWPGVSLGFISPGILAAWLGRKIWYCSEVVYYAFYNKIKRISPRRYGWFIVKDGWKHLGDGSVLLAKEKAGAK